MYGLFLLQLNSYKYTFNLDFFIFNSWNCDTYFRFLIGMGQSGVTIQLLGVPTILWSFRNLPKKNHVSMLLTLKFIFHSFMMFGQ
jgi:hypothetical protein